MLNCQEANILRCANRMTLIEAIAWQEGFWAGPHTKSARNHNPGNIEYGKFTLAHNAVGRDTSFAIFADDEAGFDCMQSLLQNHYKGNTVRAIVEVWAPPKENNTEQYIKNVCLWTNLKETDIINDFPMDQSSLGAADIKAASAPSKFVVGGCISPANAPNS